MKQAFVARAASVLALALAAAGCDRGLDPGEASALLEDYCAGCHNPVDLDGGFAVANLNAARVEDHAEVWESVVRKLRTRTMPPQAAL